MMTDVCISCGEEEYCPARKRQRLMDPRLPDEACIDENSYANTTVASSDGGMDWECCQLAMEGGEQQQQQMVMMMMGREGHNTSNNSNTNLKVNLATMFPLRHFVAKLDQGKMILKCKYCQRFEHLEGHSLPMEIPASNPQEIQRLYNQGLNLELNGHLAFCLNCSDHKVRSWGQALYQLMKHPSSDREKDNNYWVLSRSLYNQAFQQPWEGFWDLISGEQADLYDYHMDNAKSRRQSVSFPCPTCL